MIEASVGALPGLIPLFISAVLLLGIPTALIAAAKEKPLALSLLFVTSLAGVLTVTLTPGSGGAGQLRVCDLGLPMDAFLASESARLNFLLFVPLSFLAVLLFRRPLTVAVCAVALSCTIELLQAWIALGRACTYDDITSNSAGGIAGALCATGFLWIKQRRTPFTRRDITWSTVLAVIATATLTGAFHSSIATVDGDARVQRWREKSSHTERQEQWMNGTVAKLYGKHVQITGSAIEDLGRGRWRLTTETAQGNVVALWPARTLESVWSEVTEADEGRLTEHEMKASGERFVRRWFPGETEGAIVTFRALSGKRGAHLLSYRRPARGVGTGRPWRLDITIATSGRIVALKAQL
ncbi:VanZ family protein [Streptomyces natalensis]|uniref:VanZ-like domain-containing protein n=1 Tax=Streptomyces natalensis ATCC 27448 TaxID=1240678 RepID=A0A0D7CRC4_9ACTN|nr:VanZ family protein [Streptomyces natalensis]KIZ18779.1 hypothetical protein SNA_05825 [Streptomyces natalensis ATCC 27448]